MENNHILLDNIESVHTTEMGVERIRKNLNLETNEVVKYCKAKILNQECNINREGKNWYCEID